MPSDLWNFALAVYARPGVETACLRLQDQGADVCLLLCAAWLERRGIACTAQRLERLRALAQPWQEQVVVPLRQLRQGWRNGAATDAGLAALREQLKSLELAAERQLLVRLEGCARDWPAAADGDPASWLEPLLPALDDAGRAALQTLREAASQAA